MSTLTRRTLAVSATPTDRKAPTRPSSPDSATATLGRRAPVAMEVAIGPVAELLGEDERLPATGQRLRVVAGQRVAPADAVQDDRLPPDVGHPQYGRDTSGESALRRLRGLVTQLADWAQTTLP